MCETKVKNNACEEERKNLRWIGKRYGSTVKRMESTVERWLDDLRKRVNEFLRTRVGQRNERKRNDRAA